MSMAVPDYLKPMLPLADSRDCPQCDNAGCVIQPWDSEIWFCEVCGLYWDSKGALTEQPDEPLKHFVLYRFWDRDNDLLYIGKTDKPWSRWPGHRNTQMWWNLVVSITMELYVCQKSLLIAEKRAIIREKPRYNVVYNRGKKTTPKPKPKKPIDAKGKARAKAKTKRALALLKDIDAQLDSVD